MTGAESTVTLSDGFTGSGLVDITTADVATLTVALGTSTTGTRSVTATAMTDADVLTLTGTDAATVSLSTGDLTASAYLGDLVVTATAGTSVIVTGGGSDTITGGAGVDTLTGGLGADTFNHNMATDSGDTITDLTVGDDNFILTTTGLVDNAGTAVAAANIVAGSLATIDGTAAGSAAVAAGDVIIELDQASLGVTLDFSTSTAAQIVTAVEALFAGNNWDTGNAAAAYVESGNIEDLLFIVYEAAAQGATADAVLIRATGDGAADSFAGEFTVEAVLTSVAADALTSAEFI